MKYGSLISVLFMFFTFNLFAGTTGKIAGIVTDAETGDPLPGVNIVVKDMLMGAATDLDGYYVILNVPPGKYVLEASMVGYAMATVTNVDVKIDQTTQISFQLQSETLEMETIEVVAERPVVEVDVAASRANISAEEIESIPVVSVRSVVGLQAGIQGFSFRGSDTRSGRLGSDEVAMVVNGLTLRDERDNQPFTLVSLTAVEEVQVQSGGFSAEYGNFRSGMVNVVTKEGNRGKYSFSFLGRYKAPAPKHFGPSPSDPNSFWIRPYLDDEVCWTGTKNGAWDEFTQAQYPEFEGWNAVSEKLLEDDDPTNDYTPEMAQRIYKWQHRKDLEIRDPDYDVDLSFGGPVPFLSKKLGNLRFYTSYIRNQDMYLVPLSRDAYRNYMWSLKMTTDLAPDMKLMIDGFISEEWGSARSRGGSPGLFWTTGQVAYELSNGPKYIEGRMFGTDYWNPSDVYYTSIGAKFTHSLSSTTYYEASIHRFSSKYETYLGRLRDNSRVYNLGEGVFWSEEPFGLEMDQSTAGINGMRTGVGFSNARDSSFVATYTAKFDITSQLNKTHNVKAGAEFVLTDSRMNYANYDKFLPSNNSQTKWEETPVRIATYVQDKMEFEGMVAQLGLRLDYFNAMTEWYSGFDPYDPAFSAKFSSEIDELLEKQPTKNILNLSPRLGISFPISVNSKIYFNYGHFYQLPSPENLYIVRRLDETNQITRVANPNKKLPKTVSYELGFDQNVMDQILIRLAGYYKDISNQSRSVRYVNGDGSVNYYTYEPNSYEDIRGFELTINKNRGKWFRGFFNYTYMVSTYGYFGFNLYQSNPVEQRKFERETTQNYQAKPIPRPYARLNLDFSTPFDYGPEFYGFKPLEEWKLNILANWQAGSYFTYVGGGAAPPGLQYNLQYKDYYNMNLRISKSLYWKSARIEFFADIINLLNIKRLTNYGFEDWEDRKAYFNSLHLPESTEGIEFFPNNIPGDDEPGDYRKKGVDYVHMVRVDNVGNINNPDSRFLYYDAAQKDYYIYKDGLMVKADKNYVDQVLKDKAYIDMPNLTHFTFLNPRSIFWGLKVSFEL